MKKNKHSKASTIKRKVHGEFKLQNRSNQNIKSSDYYYAFSKDFQATVKEIMATPGDIAMAEVKRAYMGDISTDEGKEIYKDSLVAISNYVCFLCSEAVKGCTDVPAEMNVWSKESETAVIDKIDMREYIKEYGEYPQMALDAISSIQTIGDIGAAWTTNEFVDIMLTEDIFTRVHRDGYDTDEGVIKYTMYAYRRVRLSEDICTVVLAFACKFDVGIDGQRVVLSKTCDNPDNLDVLELDMKFVNGVKRYDVTKGLRLKERLTGLVSFIDILTYLKDEYEWHDEHDKRFMLNLMYGINLDLFFSKQPMIAGNKQKNFDDLCCEWALYAIVVTNKFIKEKKMSKPRKHYNIEACGINFADRPDRKLRVLGEKITIETEECPQIVTIDKIIKYHVTEWERKAHLRHMKDGRVIEIKASQCKRKCAEGHRSNKAKLQSTDYVIKND